MTPHDNITHIAINSQVLLNRLCDERTKGVFTKQLKFHCNKFIDELQKVETNIFDKFFDKNEESTIVVYDTYDKFISNIPIWDMQNLTRIIEAYHKDSKSIEGIVNKILR